MSVKSDRRFSPLEIDVVVRPGVAEVDGRQVIQ